MDKTDLFIKLPSNLSKTEKTHVIIKKKKKAHSPRVEQLDSEMVIKSPDLR